MRRPNGDNLKIAIQSAGRLADDSVALLEGAGIDFDAWSRKLFATARGFPLEILFVRDDDIPEFVSDGVADLGIVGRNLVEEKEADVEEVLGLGFGRCRLVIAVPRGDGIRDVADLDGRRVATSYPRTLARYLEASGVAASIVEIAGAAELTPALDVADAVCDVVSTGTTLRMNDLVELTTVLESEAVLVAHPEARGEGARGRAIERLTLRLRGQLAARRTKYVMANAPETAVERIREILPGLRAPTVVPLADPGWVAIHAALPEETFWDSIEAIRSAGASEILVLPVEKLFR
ncbi:MAG: ATP phosphoribosyltransferase [Gemmatimonadota bacterium]|nr:ATP phosphoribosyltransferase [Gemmatimonadota bacterium]